MTLFNNVNIAPRSSQTASVSLTSNATVGLIVSGSAEVSVARSIDGSLYEDASILDQVSGKKFFAISVPGCSSLRVQVANNSDASQNVTIQAGAQ